MSQQSRQTLLQVARTIMLLLCWLLNAPGILSPALGREGLTCSSPSASRPFPRWFAWPAGLQEVSISTRLLHPPKTLEDPYGSTSPPLYQTATFAQVCSS